MTSGNEYWNARTGWVPTRNAWVRYWDAAFRRSLENIGQFSPASKAAKARKRKNAARRARHQAMKDLGLVRVRGALGGVYYE